LLTAASSLGDPRRRTAAPVAQREAEDAARRDMPLTAATWPGNLTNMDDRRATSFRFNIAEAKARFSELVQKAMLGEEVIIAKGNRPLLKLVPLTPPKGPRRPGSARGQVTMAPDFDETPEDLKDYA
jgi:prevent-host-death family protein